MSAHPRRILPFAASWLLLLVLPGCLTKALWKEQRFRTVTNVPTTSEIGVEIDRNPEAGEVRALPRGEARGGSGGAWAFSPREEAEVASALLAGHGEFRARSAVFEVWPRGATGTDLSSPATLRLEGAFSATAILGLDEVADLEVGGHPAPGAEALPAPLGEILRFAAASDLAPFAGQADRQPWRIVACALVDATRELVATAARATELLGADFAAVGLTERLRRLAGLSVLAEVDYGGVRTYVLVRADALWLRQRLQVGENGLLVHTSRWVGREGPGTAGVAAATLAGTVRVHTVERRYGSEAGGTLRRVLLTPITAVIDVVTIGTACYLYACLTCSDEGV
jgi:hypothetical protein